MKLKNKMEMYANEHYGSPDPKLLFDDLYTTQGKSPREIAEIFSATAAGVRYHLRALKFEIRSRDKAEEIQTSIEALGFGDISAYFNSRWNNSFKEMGAEIGVSASKVSQLYQKFKEQMKQEAAASE